MRGYKIIGNILTVLIFIFLLAPLVVVIGTSLAQTVLSLSRPKALP